MILSLYQDCLSLYPSCNFLSIALDFQRVQEQIVIFGPNETEKTFTITTVQDNLIETTEQFSVVVSSTFDIGTTTEETVNITIIDNGKC